jgi:translation initiation factor 3 subunit L
LHGDANMQLPNLWLYEMVDEFVYQFQSFRQYKGSSKRTSEEVQALKALDAQVWDRASVLEFLQALVDKSDIVRVLERERAGEISFAANEGYSLDSSNVLPTLGYCAQIGICRLRVLTGEYEGALDALDAVDLDRDGLFTKIPGAYVATSYHVGFAYFMLGRYTDAIRHFDESIQYIERLRFGATRPHALPLLLKKQEQMYALIAIVMALVPGQQHLLDESVALGLHQKYSDKIHRMTSGEVAVFDDLFSYACPKFVASDDSDNSEAHKTQLNAFLNTVATHAVIPKLRAHLRMYTSIKLDKLAALVATTPESLKASLNAFVQGYTVKEWRTGCASALGGEDVYCGDLNVIIDGDVVRVEEMKRAKSAREFLARTNQKLSASLEDLAQAKPLHIKPSALVG